MVSNYYDLIAKKSPGLTNLNSRPRTSTFFSFRCTALHSTMKGLFTDHLFVIYFSDGDYFLNFGTLAYILKKIVAKCLQLKHYEESFIWLLSWGVCPFVKTNMIWKMLWLKQCRGWKDALGLDYGNTGCWVFQWERFLLKNQHTQRNFLNFENWTNGEPQ